MCVKSDVAEKSDFLSHNYDLDVDANGYPSHRNLTLNQKCQPDGGTRGKVSGIHPLRSMNVSANFHGNPSGRCRHISVWTTVVIPGATPLA